MSALNTRINLARKWRPQTFEDLVGQEHISKTLLNAIRANRLSQGYLFTGTRGVGKTSAVRIFAKALRCPQPISPGVPCNQCSDCTAVSEGRSVDVLEIDGASNNGVDAIREIRENAKYLPSTGTRKLYIVDEVHMLTTAAFNALLKTLEEPPAHVTFLFATTDPQKIPATVLSRCQRFDFRRVSLANLVARLSYIATQEGFSVTADALATLAREAEGSLRDAVSLLDQVLSSSSNTEINSKSVINALGLIDKQIIIDTMRAVLNRSAVDALECAGKVHLYGFDLKQYGKELLRYLRLLMIVKLLEDNKVDASQHAQNYLDISDIDVSDLKSLVALRDIEDLDMMFRALNYGLEDVARSAIPKVVLDVLLIKLASARELVSISIEEPPIKEPKASVGVVSAPVISKPAPIPTPAPHAVAPKAPTVEPKFWKGFVEFVKSQKPLVGSTLEYMGFEGFDQGNSVWTLKLSHSKDHSFYRDQLQSKAYQDALISLTKAYTKAETSTVIRFEFIEVASSRSIEAATEAKKKTEADEKRKSVLESEASRATQQLLGGRLERLEIE